jgi:hypothetical protein
VTKTGVPEQKADASKRASELREMASYSDSAKEVAALELLARIRSRDGVALTRHSENGGEFVDYAIDAFIDRWIA